MHSFSPHSTSQSVQLLFKAQKYQELVNLFKGSLSVTSSDPVTLHMYAASLRRLGLQHECQKVLKKAIKRYPSALQLKNSYANLLFELDELSEAKIILSSVTSIDPRFLDAQINLGRVNYRLGQFQPAKKAFQSALELSHLNLNASIGLAETLVAQKRYEQAITIYQELIDRGLTNLKVLNNLAGIKRRQGDLVSAISIYESAIEKYGAPFVTLKNLAVCYAKDNQIQAAKDLYQVCISKSPHDVDLHREIAEFLWSKDDKDPFLWMRNSLKTKEAPIGLWFTYIELLNNTEASIVAKEHIEELCRRHPKNPDCRLLMASMLRQEGYFSEGLAMCKSALALSTDKTNIRFQNELGYSLLSNGLGKEATSLYNVLCRREPDNQGWWTLLSSAIRQAGNIKKYSWLCDYTNLLFSDILKVEYHDEKGHDFNTELKNVLVKLHDNVKHPIGQSLRNGTQTYDDLFDDSRDVIRMLSDAVIEQASLFVSNQKPDTKHPFLSRLNEKLKYTGSWSVHLRDNGFHKSHFHPEGWLSGVYYVDVPPEVDNNGQGWLIFGRPEIPGDEYSGDFAVKPVVGKLVLFPSYFWHGTVPFLSSENSRLTVAFDLIPNE